MFIICLLKLCLPLSNDGKRWILHTFAHYLPVAESPAVFAVRLLLVPISPEYDVR